MIASDLIDKTLYAKGSLVNIRQSPSTESPVVKQVSKGNSLGIVFSWLSKKDLSGKAWAWFQVEGIAKGWVREDVVTNVKSTVAPKEEVNGETILKGIVKADYKTYHNLLVIAETIHRLKSEGKSAISYEAQASKLIKSYTERQAKIKNSKLVSFQTRFNQSYEWLKNKWSSLISGIGAIPLIPVAIGAVVALGTAATIYYLFKPDYDESVKNLKESEILKQVLSSVDPTTSEQIRKDLEGQIDKAYNSGKTDGAFNLLGLSAKNLGLIALGAFAVIKGPELLNGKKRR